MSTGADPWAEAAAQFKPSGTPQSAPQGAPPVAPQQDWKIWNQDYSPEQAGQDFGSFAIQTGRKIWEGAKGAAGLIGSAFSTMGNPVLGAGAASQLVAPQVQQGQQAAQSFGQGHYSEAVGHGLAAALPVAGPQAAEFAGKVGNQDWAGAASDLAAAGVMAAVPYGIGEGANWMRGVDPDTALWQAAPMRTSGVDYAAMSPTVRGDIKSAAAIRDAQGNVTGYRPLDDVPSVKAAVGAAKAENRAVLDMHLNPYRQQGTTFPGNPIADAIDNTVPIDLRIEAKTDPAAAQRIAQIHQIADAYRVPLTIDELRELAVKTNGDLNSFYHRTADAQNAALAQQGGVAVLEAKASAIRQMMETYFGPDVADIQRRWGYLDDVDAGLDAAYKRMLNEKPATNVQKGLRVADVPGKAFHGQLDQAQYSLKGKTNFLLKKAFDNTEPSGPLPTPQGGMPGPGGMPGAAPTSRQLPPGTPQIGEQPTYVSTSGLPPAWQQNQWQGIGAPKQLPAPEPGSAPLNVLPRGPAGAPRPAAPVGASAITDQPGLPPGLPAPPPPEGFRAVRNAPAPGAPYPAAHVTAESLATQLGRSIWRALGGPQ